MAAEEILGMYDDDLRAGVVSIVDKRPHCSVHGDGAIAGGHVDGDAYWYDCEACGAGTWANRGDVLPWGEEESAR